MLIYNIGFINSQSQLDETQLDIEENSIKEKEIVDLTNLILSLREEMDIQEITYIELVDDNEVDKRYERGN